jgi:ectoine hydroxylase-related dioxygenase (phytanoyl-CoA dioxygenase family)
MPSLLSEQQLHFYRSQDYLLVKNVIPEEILQLSRKILSRWIDDQIVKWYEEGRLQETLHLESFEHRLVKAWNLAGRPKYHRSPRRDIVSPYMFEFLKHPVMLNLASDLLETQEISVHGIFNARPKLPDQKWTDTPWHQDAQYYRDTIHSHVLSMWMPLQRVDESNSCLQVAPGFHRNKLLEGVLDDQSGFIGLSKEEGGKLTPLSIIMEHGDVLCFNQFLPHRALSNTTNAVRWSMDIRYEPTEQASESGKQQGFIARSLKSPEMEATYQQWMKQWEAIPLGSY